MLIFIYKKIIINFFKLIISISFECIYTELKILKRKAINWFVWFVSQLFCLCTKLLYTRIAKQPVTLGRLQRIH